ncbi:MAG TPA: 1,4-dihydroxy-2-naphthoate polyprenyltransferase [Candidatus Thermoplasmatota archaeon]|jgi:1,4-dihydroxy-2-naphthoate octaprenyltransferase|nr:1,4-dihydroxy-2-naphthoate polyprenyltransferase [Candidatus Thermoplasmatota archaeon]
MAAATATALERPSAAGAWLSALRLRTLSASIAPVLVGSAFALHRAFDLGTFALTLAAAVLIQVGVNLANDYYDHLKGVDRADRVGPPRVTGTLLPPRAVQLAMVGVLGLAALLGAVLVLQGGWPILAIGAVALACAIGYAGGPRPLGHAGMGEVFVFVFFGPVAVAGTLLLQTGAWPAEAWLAGVPLGLLSAAILVVNNIRDIPTDARAGKRTVAVRLGASASWMEYKVLLALSFGAVVALAYVSRGDAGALLVLVALPLAVHLAREGPRREGAALNAILVRTAALHALFGLLLALGVAL